MQAFHPDSLSNLESYNVQPELFSYLNRPALRLIEPVMTSEGPRIAILSGLHFRDGILETELAGKPRADAPMDMRGFVGIAFRVQPQASRFECFFLRPTNGAPTINYAVIILRNIFHIPIIPGIGSEMNILVSTNRIPISFQVNGRRLRS